MSQASDHVKWCLSKAKKEIQKARKLGKGPKHRGLLKIKPNIEEAEKHILKAEHNLKAISRFKEIGFSDWSIAAGFYSLYHCFLSIAFKYGYESRNQTCTIALIEWLKEEGDIDINAKFIDMLKHTDIGEINEGNITNIREEYTYGTEISIKDESKINSLIKGCQEMVDITKKIVFE